jgi:hypothetical protein
MTDAAVSAEADIFNTANEAMTESEQLEEQFDDSSNLEELRERDSVGRLRQSSVPREQVEKFIHKAVQSGIVLLDPQDRLLVQSLVNHWIRRIGAGAEETPEFVLLPGNPDDRHTKVAVVRQRAEMAERDVQARWKRWDNLQRWLKSTGGPRDFFDMVFGASALGDAYLLRWGEFRQASALGVSRAYMVTSRQKLARQTGAIVSVVAAIVLLAGFLLAAYVERDAEQRRIALARNSLMAESSVDLVNNSDRVFDAVSRCGNYTSEREHTACLVGVGLAAPSQERTNNDIFMSLGLSEADVPAFATAPTQQIAAAPSACQGWIWLGRRETGFPNIDNPPSSTPNDEVWQNATIKAGRALMIRAQQPASTSYEGEGIGQVPPGAIVRTRGLPVQIAHGQDAQYWVPITAQARNCTTVYIQYLGAENDPRAIALRDGLRGAGYIVPGIESTTLASGLREIRYIQGNQSAMAAVLARDVAAVIHGATLAVNPISISNVRTARPALEVWVDFTGQAAAQ